MLNRILSYFFGCQHGRCSFPITIRGRARRRPAAAVLTGTYVCCVDCGQEFPYDWNEMRIIRSKRQQRAYVRQHKSCLGTVRGAA
jgi:hypothetical protein